MTPAGFEVAVDGGTLAGEWFERTGDTATPLVLVHGFGGSREDWREVAGRLAPARPVIAYDQRGFGRSTGEPGYSFSHGEDLVRLLDALRIERADLCGMSLGGATALNAALDAPERVRRLVLVSPLIVGWSWSTAWIDLWKAIGRLARVGDMAAARELWWRHPLFVTARSGAAAGTLRRSIDAFAGHQWIADDQRDALPDVERLHALAAPTLLLTGARDMPDFRLIADVIAGAAPDVSRTDFDDAGHMLIYERPEAVARAIEAFLGSG